MCVAATTARWTRSWPPSSLRVSKSTAPCCLGLCRHRGCDDGISLMHHSIPAARPIKQLKSSSLPTDEYGVAPRHDVSARLARADTCRIWTLRACQPRSFPGAHYTYPRPSLSRGSIPRRSSLLLIAQTSASLICKLVLLTRQAYLITQNILRLATCQQLPCLTLFCIYTLPL